MCIPIKKKVEKEVKEKKKKGIKMVKYNIG